MDASLCSCVPEPAADVALDRLRVQTVLADALLEHRQGHLALTEARNLDGIGEVRRGVLDGVLHVGARDLDCQANLAVTELFDLRLHARPLEQTASGLRATRILAAARDPEGAAPRRRAQRLPPVAPRAPGRTSSRRSRATPARVVRDLPCRRCARRLYPESLFRGRGGIGKRARFRSW